MRTPRSFWEHNEKGVYFYRRQAYDLAIAELERAVSAAVFPLAVLYINLGAAYLGNRMYPEALASLEKGLGLDPDNQRGHWFLARTLKATGAVAEAVVEFEQAWVLDPDSPEGRAAEEDVLSLHVSAASSARSGAPTVEALGGDRRNGFVKEDDTVWRGQRP